MVCMLQVLSQDETPQLYSLVFGEGVVNDATSVVLFNAIKKLDVSKLEGWVLLHVLGDFLYLFSTSTILRIATGLLTAYALKVLYFGRHSTVREIALMALMAYLFYILAELLQLSGILMVFFCGIVMSDYAWHNVSESSRITTRHIFATLSFIAETVIFLYVGMDAFDIDKWKTASMKTSFLIVGVIIGLIMVGRAAFVFPLSILSNCVCVNTERSLITLRHQVVIWWTGLMRGAVSMALAYNQPLCVSGGLNAKNVVHFMHGRGGALDKRGLILNQKRGQIDIARAHGLLRGFMLIQEGRANPNKEEKKTTSDPNSRTPPPSIHLRFLRLFNSALIMSGRVLCKFFVHGACLKGEYCEFSHDWNDQPNNICTFYQKGVCSYGSRCRYDHVKVSRSQKSTPSSSTSITQVRSNSSTIFNPSEVHSYREFRPSMDAQTELPSVVTPVLSATKPVWANNFEGKGLLENHSGNSRSSIRPADLPICSFAAAGCCPYGESCPQMHGDMCTICGKQCLHPYRPDEREEHIKLCRKNNERLEALKHSQEIECSVCLECVLSKPTAAERKFGLLSECDHPFCISCIRNWRGNSPASGMDINTALRACPICRKLSYYVIPSVIWYFSNEQKQEIIGSYKAKLKSIDCKHFDFGNGTCPFGTSCFYKHAYRDGRLEEVVLRHLDAEDGSTVIAKNVRLSDFLSRLHL